MKYLKTFIIFGVLVATSSRAQQTPYKLTSHFDKGLIPTAPDYTNPAHWAAFPDKRDAADSIPRKAPATLHNGQATAQADVFFVHPTIYTYEPEPGRNQWNGDLTDTKLNTRTDESTILNQASIFNGSCRVFAPRYRQAHYSAFTTDTPADKQQSLDLAYEDVKAAFEWYLKNRNVDADGKPRPIVIASHSQGTLHAGRLLTEFFDGKPLQKQLVAAYLVGIATPPNYFKSIPPGETPTQTGCFVSWNTFATGFIPDYYEKALNRSLCTNPLTWSSDSTLAPRALNLGGVGQNFTFVESLVDAQSHRGLLWIGKLHIPGAAFVRNVKIWHQADYNFFWMNVRENVAARVAAFVGQ
ncbi:MAG: DUF3089 domain-containing protein [Rudanella sp.]|nr:DUF3089 domain-containing protein [Rudanella sp.]